VKTKAAARPADDAGETCVIPLVSCLNPECLHTALLDVWSAGTY
jgi:hypothetical protein